MALQPPFSTIGTNGTKTCRVFRLKELTVKIEDAAERQKGDCSGTVFVSFTNHDERRPIEGVL